MKFGITINKYRATQTITPNFHPVISNIKIENNEKILIYGKNFFIHGGSLGLTQLLVNEKEVYFTYISSKVIGINMTEINLNIGLNSFQVINMNYPSFNIKKSNKELFYVSDV